MKNQTIGKEVIVRSVNAGVFFGTLKEKNGNEVVLTDARKLHYWAGAAAVEEIAMIGTKKPNECRFTVVVPEVGITDVCQVLPCTKAASTAIQSVLEWKA